LTKKKEEEEKKKKERKERKKEKKRKKGGLALQAPCPLSWGKKPVTSQQPGSWSSVAPAAVGGRSGRPRPGCCPGERSLRLE
jgi:hypothetical protein